MTTQTIDFPFRVSKLHKHYIKAPPGRRLLLVDLWQLSCPKWFRNEQYTLNSVRNSVECAQFILCLWVCRHRVLPHINCLERINPMTAEFFRRHFGIESIILWWKFGLPLWNLEGIILDSWHIEAIYCDK